MKHSGSVYSGLFENDLYHGEGTLVVSATGMYHSGESQCLCSVLFADVGLPLSVPIATAAALFILWHSVRRVQEWEVRRPWDAVQAVGHPQPAVIRQPQMFYDPRTGQYVPFSAACDRDEGMAASKCARLSEPEALNVQQMLKGQFTIYNGGFKEGAYLL